MNKDIALLDIVHPEQKDFDLRDRLLQSTLRPSALLFPIASEYPLVLSETAATNSYCIIKNEKIISHSNFLIRNINDSSNQNNFKIGLIGNVATHPDYRGQGLVRKTFSLLEAIAIESGCAAIILWSDLLQFYQKLGYDALGQEQRLHLGRQKLPTLPHFDLWIPEESELSTELCEKLLRLRCDVNLTVERSAEDFLSLLTIPETTLICLGPKSAPTAFGIVGKGYDMQGVIHEFGWSYEFELSAICEAAMAVVDSDEIILLAPLSAKLPKTVCQMSTETEIHPMALAKRLLPSQDVEDLFIWGLDSI